MINYRKEIMKNSPSGFFTWDADTSLNSKNHIDVKFSILYVLKKNTQHDGRYETSKLHKSHSLPFLPVIKYSAGTGPGHNMVKTQNHF